MSPTYQNRARSAAVNLHLSEIVQSGARKRLALPVMAYLLLVILPIQYNLGSLALNGSRTLLMVMLIPLSIQLMRGKYGPILWTDTLFFLHILWMVVSMYKNNPSVVVQYIGSTAIEFLGGYLLARAYIRSVDDFIALSRILVLIGCSLIPFAIYESLTEATPILNLLDRIPGVTSLVNVKAEARLGLQRAQVVFSHPIHFGLFCSVLFSICFIGLKTIISDKSRYFASLLLILGVFLSLASGALLALLLQLGLILWAWIFNKVNNRWLLLLGLFVLIYVLIDLLSNRAPIRVFMSYATMSAHTAYWRGIIFEWGIKNIVANPIFGIGLNEWIRPIFMRSTSVDNFWLLTTMRYGIPGFLLLAIGFLISLLKIGTRNCEGDHMLHQVRRAWMFPFVGLTFTLSTVHIWGTIYSFVFFMFGAGMWLMTAKSDTRQVVSENHLEKSSRVPRRNLLKMQEAVSPEIERTAVTMRRDMEQDINYSRFSVRKK